MEINKENSDTSRIWVLQDESRASVRPKGLGVGGARKRLRLVERESKRLQQVCLARQSHLQCLPCKALCCAGEAFIPQSCA